MVLSKFAPHRPENVGDVELRFPQLTLLRDLVESHCETEQKPACIDAAVTLFEAIAWLMDNGGSPQQMKVIWGWGNKIDEVFLDMCSAQHAVALVILAHYAVLMSLNMGLWHLRSWPVALLRNITALPKDEWDEALRWPTEMISVTATSASSVPSSCTLPESSGVLTLT